MASLAGFTKMMGFKELGQMGRIMGRGMAYSRSSAMSAIGHIGGAPMAGAASSFYARQAGSQFRRAGIRATGWMMGNGNRNYGAARVGSMLGLAYGANRYRTRNRRRR